jgi:hypothetical protein
VTKKIEWVEDINDCHICVSHLPQMTVASKKRNFETWYPVKWIGEKKSHMPLHRWVWIQIFGEIENGMVVRHVCNNPCCINIDHLVLGTQRENIVDREIADRTSYGERHTGAKLSNSDVLEIFKITNEYAGKDLREKQGVKFCEMLAKKYGVSTGAIVDIKLGRTWARVTMGLPRCQKRAGRS